MKTLNSIALATVIAAVSGLVQANGIETYGRSAPSSSAGVSVPTASAVDVAAVQGRASTIRAPQGGKASELAIVARSAAQVQGRS